MRHCGMASADDPPSRDTSESECFVILPLGAANSDVRKRSNQIFHHVITPAVEPLGFKVTRGDTLEQSGQISSQIIEKLLNAELVVADLTDHNPNVFYELAVRHSVGKPYIQVIAEAQKLPFDIQGIRTVSFLHTDLDSVDDAKNSIAGMARSFQEGARVETPLNYTMDLQSLRHSEDSDKRGIAEIIDEVSALKRLVVASRARHPKSQDIVVLRSAIEELLRTRDLAPWDIPDLRTSQTSPEHDRWAKALLSGLLPPPQPVADDDMPF